MWVRPLSLLGLAIVHLVIVAAYQNELTIPPTLHSNLTEKHLRAAAAAQCVLPEKMNPAG